MARVRFGCRAMGAAMVMGSPLFLLLTHDEKQEKLRADDYAVNSLLSGAAESVIFMHGQNFDAVVADTLSIEQIENELLARTLLLSPKDAGDQEQEKRHHEDEKQIERVGKGSQWRGEGTVHRRQRALTGGVLSKHGVLLMA